MASNLNWSTKKIKSNLDRIRPKSKTFRFNVKGTGCGRFHHAESTGGVVQLAGGNWVAVATPAAHQ
jgi:hypothetical protein